MTLLESPLLSFMLLWTYHWGLLIDVICYYYSNLMYGQSCVQKWRLLLTLLFMEDPFLNWQIWKENIDIMHENHCITKDLLLYVNFPWNPSSYLQNWAIYKLTHDQSNTSTQKAKPVLATSTCPPAPLLLMVTEPSKEFSKWRSFNCHQPSCIWVQ